MTVHELKIWPEYFQPVLEGRKRFEKRKADRDYKVGDTLRLKEWDPEMTTYTGRVVDVVVTYILDGPFSEPGVCLMSVVRPSDDQISEMCGYQSTCAGCPFDTICNERREADDDLRMKDLMTSPEERDGQ